MGFEIKEFKLYCEEILIDLIEEGFKISFMVEKETLFFFFYKGDFPTLRNDYVINDEFKFNDIYDKFINFLIIIQDEYEIFQECITLFNVRDDEKKYLNSKNILDIDENLNDSIDMLSFSIKIK